VKTTKRRLKEIIGADDTSDALEIGGAERQSSTGKDTKHPEKRVCAIEIYGRS
jgi:tRNA G46 methylase TrmB